MTARTRIPEDIQHRVLDRSRRRCALCIHFDNDWSQKEGQIAHLDRNPSNFAEHNLAFFCLPHHDVYDTQRRQTKNLTIREAKTARDRLHAFIEGGGDLATVGQQSMPEKAKWRGDLSTNRDAVERVGPAVNQGPLRLEVGEAGEFFETKRAGYSLRTHIRILKIRISNSDPHKSLFECKIHVTNITPHEYDGPWLLTERFSLAASDHEFVPLASYKEPDNIKISPYGATFMEILVRKNRPKPSSSMQHVLTIRATALDSPSCEIQCKLWVDDDGRLRIDIVQ